MKKSVNLKQKFQVPFATYMRRGQRPLDRKILFFMVFIKKTEKNIPNILMFQHDLTKLETCFAPKMAQGTTLISGARAIIYSLLSNAVEHLFIRYANCRATFFLGCQERRAPQDFYYYQIQAIATFQFFSIRKNACSVLFYNEKCFFIISMK